MTEMKETLKSKSRQWLIDNLLGMISDNNKLKKTVYAKKQEVLMLVSMLEEATKEEHNEED